MAQICRINRTEVPALIRNFHGIFSCCKRYQSTYYEILRISEDATQKEIKEAFIKLSKEMHPDSGNKGNHSDFVKLNEAYSVLSKKDSRYCYDMDLKYNIKSTNNDFHRYNYQYQRPNMYPTNEFNGGGLDRSKLLKAIGFCIMIMVLGTLIQLSCIMSWTDYKRNESAHRMQEYEEHYQRTKHVREKLIEQYKLKNSDK